MSSALTAFRVFIASPGGLQSERESFRQVLTAYNEAEAIERGVTFIPVGWEATLGGVGRPQGIINEEVRRCDYFILLLWDRWGSPPSKHEGRYTSGTEEEFNVALERLRDSSTSMRQIVVFFKALDVRQLSDPGPQLQKVLEFKKSLEREKTLLFHTIDDRSAFDAILRKHLAMWVRDHETGVDKVASKAMSDSAKQKSLTLFMGPTDGQSNLTRSALVDQAERAANLGHYTEAELLYAKAVARGNDPDAMNCYGQFLRVIGRFEQAKVVIRMAEEWAKQTKNDYWLGVSLNSLSGLYHDKGEFSQAHQLARRALEILEEACGASHTRVAHSLDHIGAALLAQGEFAKANQLFQRAYEIRKASLLADDPDLARSLNNLASTARQKSDFTSAEPLYREALELLNKSPNARQSEITRSLHGLGIIYYTQGRFLDAEPLLHRALHMTSATLELDHPLVARSHHDLGMLYAAQGKMTEAESLLNGALEVAEKGLGPDHPNLAFGLNGLAQLLIKENRHIEAEPLLKRAIRIREKALGANHPLLVSPFENLMSILTNLGRNAEASDIAKRIADVRSKATLR